jgi:hypothetical protein
MAGREGGEGEQVLGAIAQHRLELGELAAEHPGDDVELVMHVGGVRLSEDGPDGRGDHLG